MIHAHAYTFDIIFISYDEPNADENYEHLKTLVQHAKRVHGIKGIDTAHKKAAKISYSDHFFVIDGDTKVNDWFFSQILDDINPNYVYSWSAENIVNGLQYGNGGAKLWPKHTMLNLKSHEENGGIDFCWTVPYYQMDAVSSVTHINTTPFQVFRTGYREGVRMGLDNGKVVNNPKKDVWIGNYHRLLSWMNIGADVKNGFWSMLGARIGCYESCLSGLDITLISDYEWFENMWEKEWCFFGEKDLIASGKTLAKAFKMPISNLDSNGSKFAKMIQYNPPRSGLMLPELADETYLRNLGLWKDD